MRKIWVSILRCEDGEPLWENSPRTTDEGIDRIQDPPALTPEAAYVTSEKNEIHRVDAAAGEIVWTVLPAPPTFIAPVLRLGVIGAIHGFA